MITDSEVIQLLNFDTTITTVSEVVAGLIDLYGVPTDTDEVYRIASSVLPVVLDQRARLAMRTTEVILQSTTLTGAAVARPDFLPLPFIAKDISRAVGLTPDSINVSVSMIDPLSQELAKVSILPFTAPDSEEVVNKVIGRVSGSASHRALNSQREVVKNTAYENTRKWAWRLTGRNNCISCLERASRGVFFTKDGPFTGTHDNCKCYTELVEDEENWNGKDTAEELATIIKYNSERAAGSYKNADWAAIKKEFEMERTDIG